MRDWREPNDRAKSLGRMRGWAPGDYICRCVGCDRDHVADKRSVRCFECAATEEIAELRKKVADLLSSNHPFGHKEEMK